MLISLYEEGVGHAIYAGKLAAENAVRTLALWLDVRSDHLFAAACDNISTGTLNYWMMVERYPSRK